MRAFLARFWPRRLSGQMVLLLALALFAAQIVNATIILRGQQTQAEDRAAATVAVRVISALERLERGAPPARFEDEPPLVDSFRRGGRGRRARFDLGPEPQVEAGAKRLRGIEARVTEILDNYGLGHGEIRAMLGTMAVPSRLRAIEEGVGGAATERALVVSVQRPQGDWLSLRILAPPRAPGVVIWFLFQTVLIYLVLLIPMIWIARRISRPLGELRDAMRRFRDTQQVAAVPARGPADVAELIAAFNRMSTRISAMLDEKDVMLGAIGHDLKTPLAALRVRIESVPDERIRDRMAATIADLTATLDDILTLARIGRAAAEREPVNLTALIETLVEEYDDIGADVLFEPEGRLVLPLQATWIKRALRNLIDNAIRYGERARISVAAEGDWARIRVEDDGPGIPEADIGTMLDAFARGEASRNTATGGAGLGLAIARAIAEQHDGSLAIANRKLGKDIDGLVATLSLPLTRRAD